MNLREPIQITGWEALWAPYDSHSYAYVLEQLSQDDVVYEIGAGDLRLARQMAGIARHVYAVELQPGLLEQGGRLGLPKNITAWTGDARFLSVPKGVTVAVLLMRHCTHFVHYAEKLRAAGCQKLITNARWRLDVETVMLQAERLPYEKLSMGWYACFCGATGFLEGPAEQLSFSAEAVIHEVSGCPRCLFLKK